MINVHPNDQTHDEMTAGAHVARRGRSVRDNKLVFTDVVYRWSQAQEVTQAEAGFFIQGEE